MNNSVKNRAERAPERGWTKVGQRFNADETGHTVEYNVSGGIVFVRRRIGEEITDEKSMLDPTPGLGNTAAVVARLCDAF